VLIFVNLKSFRKCPNITVIHLHYFTLLYPKGDVKMTKVNVIPAEIPKRFISVTDTYGLVPDGYNYTLYRLVTVDPTKSPNYKPDGNPVVIRQVWRNADRHYPMSPRGLRSALTDIAYRNGVSDEEQTTIERHVAAVDGWVKRLESLNLPEVNV